MNYEVMSVLVAQIEIGVSFVALQLWVNLTHLDFHSRSQNLLPSKSA